MRRLALIGAGGHGKVAAEVAEACGWQQIVFLDRSFPERRDNGRWPIVGASEDRHDPEAESLFCTIGDNSARARLFQADGLADRLADSPVLVHPSAIVSPSASLGAGTLLVAGAIVNAEARIGRGVILNTACSVDHDCVLDDFVHVSPGARLAGGVRVGARSWIGAGAVVREGVTIGADVVVAAGAAVIRDIDAGLRVGGVPARPI